jgi:hypothetical protein
MTPFQDARRFLARVVPWPEEGEDGYIAIVKAQKPRPGYKKGNYSGRASRSLDQAVRDIGWFSSMDDTTGIFVCMSRQAQAEPKIDRNGRTYYRAIRSQAGALALKSIWLDIDIKDGPKGYKDEAELGEALAKFLVEVGLPKPNGLVHTGGGIHAHWIMDRALNTAEWQALADALDEAATKHGLRHDAITGDSSRILRLPDTINKKYDPPRQAKLLLLGDDYTVERLWQALEPYRVAVKAKVNGHAKHNDIELPPEMFLHPRPMNGYTNELSAGIETNDTMPEDELRMCVDAIPNPGTDWVAWNTMGMRIYAATDGADYGLAEWERWSSKNPDGNVNDKDTCAERWETYATSPPTHTGAGALVNAARAALGDPKWMPRSKLAQVTAAVTSGIALPPLPFGYVRDAEGCICITRTDSDDKGRTWSERILEYPIFDAQIQRGQAGESDVLFIDTAVKDGDPGLRTVALELKDLNGMGMRAAFQSRGVMLPRSGARWEMVGDFMEAWVRQLQQSKASINPSSYGWVVEKGSIQGFIYGKKFTPTGEEPAGHSDPVTATLFTPSGLVDPWYKASQLVTDQKRPDLNVIFASTFAAPLMKFVGENGLIVNACSESGAGKSTALYAALSVWGHAKKGAHPLSGSYKSLMNKMGHMRSLPVYIDEVRTDEQMIKLNDMCFDVAGGHEATRLTRNIRQRATGDWQTLLVTCTNNGLLDWLMNKTQTDAATLYRIFQFRVGEPEVDGPGRIERPVASMIKDACEHNYGHIGLIYAKWLGENHARVAKDVLQMGIALDKEANATDPERNWMSFITVTLVGATYANALGFAEFDVPAMKAFLFDTLAVLRAIKIDNVKDLESKGDVKELMAQFIAAHSQRHMLVTDKMPIGAGRVAKGSIKSLCDITRLDSIIIQSSQDGFMRIDATRLGDWIAHNKKLPKLKILDAMKRELGMRLTNGILGAGIEDLKAKAQGKQRIYELEVSSFQD